MGSTWLRHTRQLKVMGIGCCLLFLMLGVQPLARQSVMPSHQQLMLSGHSPNATSASCPAPGSRTTGNWADNEAINQCKVGLYRSASFDFYVPTINTSVSDAQVGIWAGVGGDSIVQPNNVLVQAGVVITVVNGHQFNKSFWEVVPGFTAQDMPLCRLAAGDHISVLVQSNLNNDGYDFFSMSNLSVPGACSADCQLDTTSIHSSYGACANVPGKRSYNSDSASGECALEQVYDNNYNPYPLAEWTGRGPGEGTHYLALRSCNVQFTAVGSQTHIYSDITNPSTGAVLASTGSIVNYGQDFTVTWRRSN